MDTRVQGSLSDRRIVVHTYILERLWIAGAMPFVLSFDAA